MAISYQYYTKALDFPEKAVNVQITHYQEKEFLTHGLSIFPNLENLSIDYRDFKTLEDKLDECKKLKSLVLVGNEKATQLPESLKQLNTLEHLTIFNYDHLTTFSGFENFKNLKTLALHNLENITNISDTIAILQNLKTLKFRSCNKLKSLPDTLGNLANLEELALSSLSSLNQLPDTIGNLSQLKKLDIGLCTSLKTLPDTIGNLKNLTVASLQIKALPEEIKGWQNLKELTYMGTGLPANLYELKKLQKLTLKENPKLVDFSENIEDLKNLEILTIEYCNNLTTLPASISKLKNLTSISIKSKGFNSLPENIGELPNLKTITLYYTQVSKLPISLAHAKSLEEISLGYTSMAYIPLEILAKKDLNFYYEHTQKNFLEFVRKSDFTDFSYRLALDLLANKEENLKNIALEKFYELFKFTYRPLYDLTCKYLLPRLPSSFQEKEISTMSIYIVGSLRPLKIDEVKQQLQEAGLSIAKKLDEKVSHVLVGYAPGKEFEQILQKTLPLILPDHLNMWLQSKKEKSFLEEVDLDTQANLIQLIISKDESNQLIALQMLQQGKIPENLQYPLLLIRIFGHEYFTKITRKEFDKLVTLQFPSAWKAYFSKKDDYYAAIKKLIKALKDATIDAEQLLKVGFDFFEDNNQKFMEFLVMSFSINSPLADKMIAKKIYEQSLDFRNLIDIAGKNDFTNFDANKYAHINELWIKSAGGGISEKYLPLINAMPHIKMLKVYLKESKPTKERIIEVTERFKKKFSDKNIEVIKL